MPWGRMLRGLSGRRWRRGFCWGFWGRIKSKKIFKFGTRITRITLIYADFEFVNNRIYPRNSASSALSAFQSHPKTSKKSAELPALATIISPSSTYVYSSTELFFCHLYSLYAPNRARRSSPRLSGTGKLG